ncbi:fimbria/pilus outer membrane usher protein [Variovorax robiniae]|uniref:Fimbria/pilus outer membrane usher protein n=1 Tax=Variovorax robiniae TaxID=1836199 RepID=A0ABU8X8B5_9BURK
MTQASPAAAVSAPSSAKPAAGAAATDDLAEFNSAFVSAGVDTARFAEGNPLDPGVYSVDVYLNDRMLQRADMQVVLSDTGRKQIVLPASVLRAANVKEEFIAAATGTTPVGVADTNASTDESPSADADTSAKGAPQVANDTLVRIEGLGEAAKATFDANEYRLNLSLPQIMLLNQPRGYVDPSLWDAGSSGLLVNYVANGYHSSARGITNDSAYLGLRAGFNLGLWQYRNNSSLSWGTRQGVTFQSNANYIQRALPSIGSVVRMGDSYSSPRFSTSMPMRGVVLTSDERMLPDSQRGFAPVVRGVARSNARVTVRQHDAILYETTVSAGPFEITDLYPTGYGGDLKVTVLEADGSQQAFTVPYAAIPDLLRPGHAKHEVAIGKVKDSALKDAPYFAEAVYQRGLTNSVTGTAGVQVGSNRYASAMGGVAFNTPIGAFGSDLTLSHAALGDEDRNGWSLRTSYSKYLASTGTNLGLAVYRYSSGGFASLRDAAYLQQARDDVAAMPLEFDSTINQRQSFQLYASQPIGSGSLYASGSVNDYWGDAQRTSTFQVGYSNSIGSANYSVNLARTYDPIRGQASNGINFTLSIPLGKDAGAPQMSASLGHTADGHSTAQTQVSGAMLDNRSLSYSAYAAAGRDNASNNASVGGSLAKTTGVGTLQGTASAARGFKQASAGMSGSLLVHGGGVTFGQSTGDTVGLIEAKGAKGATVTGRTNVTVDGNGYAIVPSLSSYRENEIGLDPKGTSDDVELLETTRRVAPYDGAVVKLPFETSTGKPTLLVLESGDSRVPLGATARDAKGRELGVVGGEGRLLLRDLADSGTVRVSWGTDKEERQCSIDLARLGKPTKDSTQTGGIEVHELPCEPTTGLLVTEPARKGTEANAAHKG